MSAKDAAERLLSAPSKISRIETAQRNATLRDVRDLCEIYGVHDEDARRRLMELARGSRERGWWQGAELPPALESLIGMEGSALAIREIELALVPGLLQTRDYATAMADAYIPGDDKARTTSVDIRMKRQDILWTAAPPVVEVVLDEAVLRRVIGDRAIMRRQLSHLIDMMASNIQLRIVPFSAGVHFAMMGGFTILDFAAPGDPGSAAPASSVVYIETYGPGVFIDNNDSIQQYLTAFDKTRALAMPPEESLDLLRSVVRDL